MRAADGACICPEYVGFTCICPLRGATSAEPPTGRRQVGCVVVPLVTEVAFPLSGHWAGNCGSVFSSSVLPLVSSSHSLAEVEKMELIYLEEQIKINLSPIFLHILKAWHAPLQLRRAALGLL